uniref:Uncharacterized protein n=1 Tax=Candidatus Kentrum sp. LPFa TaxID=2126335 RepID=A0A450WRM2_9GAMM|nr:MAG: hypothetical protein BECKLPF1236A_GA0070988_102335 [Candidatus Kentron sp. LPFa]VFK33936.1 MAG: hypothetical protein BECKLPF1236C_GA0070990_102322 [Candidatus Kentron sp. LPFa]
MHKIPLSGRDDIFFIYAMEFWFRLGRVGMLLWYFIHSVSKYALLSNLYHEQAGQPNETIFPLTERRTEVFGSQIKLVFVEIALS